MHIQHGSPKGRTGSLCLRNGSSDRLEAVQSQGNNTRVFFRLKLAKIVIDNRELSSGVFIQISEPNVVDMQAP